MQEKNLALLLVGRARLTRWIIVLGGACAVGFLLWQASFAVVNRWQGAPPRSQEQIDLVSLLVTVAAYAGVFVYGFWRLFRMLRLIEAGEVFTLAVVSHLRAFAFCLLLASVVMDFAPLLLRAALSLALSGSRGPVDIMVGVNDICLLIVCLVLFLVVRLIERAHELQEEHNKIV